MDLLVETVGTGPTGLSDAERERFVKQLPNGIAAALGLRYLSELRCIYPGVCSDVDSGAKMLQYELEAVLLQGRLKLTRSWPFLSSERWREVDLELVGVMSVLAMWDPRSKQDDSKESITAVLRECERKASPIVRTIIDESRPLMFACDIPNAEYSQSLNQPLRYFTLLERYWDAAMQIAVVDERSYFRYSPHPLLRWLVSLRARLKACIEKLEIPTNSEVAELIDWFVSYAIEDDGDWGLLPDEYFHSKLKKVGAFVEELRISRRFFVEGETTLWERLYLDSFAHALSIHRDKANEQQRRMNAKLSQIREERHGGTVDKAASGQVHEPALPRLNEKQQRALQFISARGPVKAVIIARELSIKESTFRTHYVPVLEKHGVRNHGNGYLLASERRAT
jgi:hypothetical protein